ncbi:MAG: SEC-C domain-containing protein [Planctomycetes bacterium]|nr:SEC-C domain-containing protein [Planctomycetota bacterium]
MPRLSESKIKEAILRPELDVRVRAIAYFAKSFSTDRSIMPLVIQAVETYGREDAYQLIGSARDLPQTEQTIAWFLDELNNEQSSQFENYTYNLSMAMLEADPALLLGRESAILNARHFLAPLHEPFTERLRMLAWDEATCWRALEEFCEERKDEQDAAIVNLPYAGLIVEALARSGVACEEKVHAVLSQKVDDVRHHPMKWLEPLVVRLAGQARLDSTTPLLVTKLQQDEGDDLLNHECTEALCRIGSSDVLEAIDDVYLAAPYHFRLYATGPLERIHSDRAVEICLDVLEEEQDDRIRGDLAHALLTQFASEGIEQARRLLVGRTIDERDYGRWELRNYLLETCAFTGERFPEFEEWYAAEKAEREEHQRRIKEIGDDSQGQLLYALERLAGRKLPKNFKPKLPPPQHPRVPPPKSAAKRVGRNDPCPCGSGKKFKACCLRRQGTF